ncbi:MAG: hypothetical protein SV375_11800 [Thermodesulfobacteriota bacterium]|nr:hypothetical protein [Thermodesulfobacteriota bacterium]
MTITKKKIKWIFHIAIVLLLTFVASSWARNDDFSPYMEFFPKGKIDWDSGYFYGVGIGYPHLNKGSRARALKVAQASALSAILQVASQLRVDDKHTLSGLEKRKIIIQIKALIYYEPHERRYIKKGKHPFYEVTYRAPMKGVKGLTKKLLTHMRSRPPLRQYQPAKEAIDDGDDSSPWLVLDARGLEKESRVKPAIFPKIVTGDGETVYDLNTVEEGALVDKGMVRYVVSDESLEELGFIPDKGPIISLRKLFSTPVVLAEEKLRRKKRGKYIITNVKQAQGLMKTNLLISESDANNIRKEDASSQILKKCRVIVIVSRSIGGVEGKRKGVLNWLSRNEETNHLVLF